MQPKRRRKEPKQEQRGDNRRKAEKESHRRAAHAVAGRKVCREVACEGLGTTAGYCRLHYIKNWRKIKRKEVILKEGKLGIRVTDVTAALRAIGAAAAAPPATADTNPETGKITISNPPVDPKYDEGTPADDVFEFVHNEDTHAIGIKLSPTFSGVATDTYYRVAVILREVEPVDVKDEDNVLSLQYAGGYRVSALRESLRLAARDVVAGMKGREVYVFYIKLLK